MSKRIFVLLLVLMSVSLIGIIFIQYFFILKNYEENNKQFSINVNYVLEETTSDVERNEFRKYVRKFRDLIENEALVDVDTLSIQNLIIIDENPEKRETIIYKNGVIEENLIIPKTKSYYDDIIAQYRNITLKQYRSPAERAKDFGSKMGKLLSQSLGQTIDNTVNEVEDQVDAVLESSGVKDQIRNVTQQIQPAINQARTSVNEVRNVASAPTINPPAAGTQIAGVDITNPANAFSLGLNPSDIAIAQRTRGTA